MIFSPCILLLLIWHMYVIFVCVYIYIVSCHICMGAGIAQWLERRNRD